MITMTRRLRVYCDTDSAAGIRIGPTVVEVGILGGDGPTPARPPNPSRRG